MSVILNPLYYYIRYGKFVIFHLSVILNPLWYFALYYLRYVKSVVLYTLLKYVTVNPLYYIGYTISTVFADALDCSVIL